MTKRTKRTQKIDIYQELTDRIIRKIEAGVKPWQPTWSRYGLARNAATGHIYSGVNAFILNLFCEHPIPYYMSFKQAKAMGGNIRKGAKAERVYFYKSYYKDESGKNINAEQAQAINEMGGETQRIAFLKFYHVFNIADVEGVEVETPEITLTPHERIAACEAVVEGYQNAPELVHENADQAYYSPSSDKLNMPQLEQFKTPEAYYLTLFHEMTHSTGHESRLNREGITKPAKFKSERYSREELIAEMGAAFLAGHTGIDGDDEIDNSAAYLEGWLKVLKEDNKLIFKAAADAQKAVDHILGK
jgi:antirestriction protein ArdC